MKKRLFTDLPCPSSYLFLQLFRTTSTLPHPYHVAKWADKVQDINRYERHPSWVLPLKTTTRHTNMSSDSIPTPTPTSSSADTRTVPHPVRSCTIWSVSHITYIQTLRLNFSPQSNLPKAQMLPSSHLTRYTSLSTVGISKRTPTPFRVPIFLWIRKKWSTLRNPMISWPSSSISCIASRYRKDGIWDCHPSSGGCREISSFRRYENLRNATQVGDLFFCDSCYLDSPRLVRQLIPTHAAEILAHGVKHHYPSLVNGALPFLARRPLVEVLERLPPQYYLAFVSFCFQIIKPSSVDTMKHGTKYSERPIKATVNRLDGDPPVIVCSDSHFGMGGHRQCIRFPKTIGEGCWTAPTLSKLQPLQ